MNVFSRVVYGVGMFCYVTTAAQHQTFSVRLGASLAGRVAGHATSRLWQRNTRWASLVPAQTSVGAQRRRQTDTPIRYTTTDTSTSHRCCETFTGCGLLNASTSSWLCLSTDGCMVWRHGIFPTTSSSSLILIAAVSGGRRPRRRSRVSGGRMPPLEQSVI